MSMAHLFNPQFQSREELSSLLMDGNTVLPSFFQHLKEPESSKHQLMVAPWGGGKTHFLQVAFNRICEEEELSSKFSPVFISGRDNFFAGFSDFLDWLLEKFSGFQENADYLAEYQAIKERCSEINDRWEQTTKLLEKMAQEKKFFLCIDDFDVLLDYISHDPSSQKHLPSFLALTECFVVLGTTCADLNENKKNPSSLTGLFDHIPIAPLDEKSMLELLNKKADLNGNSGVLKAIQSDPSLISTLFPFAKGNPRVAMMLYDVLERQGPLAPYPLLLGLLDLLSPYYRSLIQNTPAKERKLLDSLLQNDNWMPPSKLARGLGWEGKEVSVLLKRLMNRGLVKKVRAGSKKSFYGAAEPLFCAYYHIWHVERLKESPGNIIDFLHHVTSCKQWEEGKGEESAGDLYINGLFYVEPNLAGAPDFDGLTRIQQLFKEKKGVELEREINSLLQTWEADPERKPVLLFSLGFLYSLKGEHEKAMECYRKCSKKASTAPLILNNMGSDYLFLGLQEKAMKCFLQSLELQNDFPPALANLGVTYCQLEENEKAVDFFIRFEKVAGEKLFLSQLQEPFIHLIFKNYSLSVEKMFLVESEEKSLSFVEERLSFIQSLPPHQFLPALISFLLPLTKPAAAPLASKVFDSIKATFPIQTVQALQPISLALQYLESDDEEVLLVQNEEIRNAARMVLSQETR